MTRLTSRCPPAQPGVASVYCAIVQQTRDGSEFYIKDFPELAGTCYADARRRFNSATLCVTVQIVSLRNNVTCMISRPQHRHSNPACRVQHVGQHIGSCRMWFHVNGNTVLRITSLYPG